LTFARAIGYFVREASVNLIRGWKVSLLATLTIAVSLFIGGSFMVVARGFAGVVEGWKKEAKVVVYFDRHAEPESRASLLNEVRDAPWVLDVEEVTEDQANSRFQETFPSLVQVLQGWGESPFPASLEVEVDPLAVRRPDFQSWASELRNRSQVAMVDDDSEWLAQLERAIQLFRALGIGLGTVLLCAAVFTISSVIRLTAFLYRDEIAVMRLVGATEFFIRGPFYTEGLLQGAVGGATALLSLAVVKGVVLEQLSYTFSMSGIEGVALPWQQQLILWSVGVGAGFAGAILSLRREVFGES
jgi:cell division transport system permease protein